MEDTIANEETSRLSADDVSAIKTYGLCAGITVAAVLVVHGIKASIDFAFSR